MTLFWIALWQVAVTSAVLFMVLLILGRTVPPLRYHSYGTSSALALTCIAASVLAGWGTFVRPWPIYAGVSAVAVVMVVAVALAMLEAFGRGTLRELGPAIVAFMLPLVVFALLTPLCGLVNWIIW
jgi:hypothetical protein